MQGTQRHTGAVCFIDLLGFSYLTELIDKTEELKDENNKSLYDKLVKDITLSEIGIVIENLKNHNLEGLKSDINNKQTVGEWASGIVNKNLINFHESIKKNSFLYKCVDCVIISDSAFLVSENSDAILFIIANVFRDCIKKGILLRAGLTYGTYYTVTTGLEKLNVYGPAVTKAVEYEKSGKGCRIFTDSDFPSNCLLFRKNYKLFQCYTNYLDYKSFDVFEWLMIYRKYVITSSDISSLLFFSNRLNNVSLDNLEKINEIKEHFTKPNALKSALSLFFDNQKVYCYLRYSPDFEWNLHTELARTQMYSSIGYVTNAIDNVYRLYPQINLKNYSEGITEELEFIGKQKRSEQEVKNVFELKKLDVCKVLGFSDCDAEEICSII